MGNNINVEMNGEKVIVTPPVFARNERGLVENIEYKYLPDGRIDWRAMLKPEHFVINRQYEKELSEKFGKPLAEIKPEEVEDKYLLILLAGIKYIAALRGFLSVRPRVDEATGVRCVVTTIIRWIPNFETCFAEVEFGDVASASLENTFSWAQQYLEPIAANRAFVRAVRNYLGILIVANDEIGPNKVISEDVGINSGFKPSNLLERKVDSLGLDFKKFKDGIIAKYKNKVKSDPEKWESYEKIPPNDIYILLSILEEKK